MNAEAGQKKPVIKPLWIELAERHIGLTESAGEANNPEIVQFWKDIKRGGIKSDAVPWCAAFVGACLERAGVKSSRFEGAKSYMTWGEPLAEPTYGCIVIFNRDGGGHVGFVVGQDTYGALLVLGGNQGDQVNVRAFSQSRVVGYRWPTGQQMLAQALPAGHGETSRTEA